MSLSIPLSYESTLVYYPLPWNPWKAPHGLKVSSDGMVWFTESGVSEDGTEGNAIARFNPLTKVFTEFKIPTPCPSGQPLGTCANDLDIDSSGRIWFTEFRTGKIGRLDPATGRIAEFSIPTPNSQPYGIKLDSQGNVWFAEYGGNKIGELTSSGIIKEFPIPDANSATKYLAPDSQGRIWFAETGAAGYISVLDPGTGIVTQYMPPTSNNIPNGILVDSRGFVWFTEYLTNKIARFNPSSLLFYEFSIPYAPGDQPNPWLLTEAPDGSIWFSGDQQNGVEGTATGVAGRIDLNSGMINVYKLPKPPMGGTLDNHPKGIGADQSGSIWIALWDTDYIAQLQFAPTIAMGAFNSLVSSGTSFTLQKTVSSSQATPTGSTVTATVTSRSVSTGTGNLPGQYWMTTRTTSEIVTKATTASVSGTFMTALPVSNALSSGPSGDQSSTSTTFTPSVQTITLNADGSTTYLALATSQLWDSSPTIGASIAVCRDGTRISGDMFSLGATASHRHLASAIAFDQPPQGSHIYSLCYKTDTGGTAFVSGAYIVILPANGGLYSGPHGDQSTPTTDFAQKSAESITVSATGSTQYLILASSQLWDSSVSIGASIAICKNGARISGDMFSVGAIESHRHLAAATALDLPAGQVRYDLCYKTDPGGTASVSGTYLVAVPIQGAVSSGPHGDQSTTSTFFTPSAESITVTPSSPQQYLLLASSQLWDSSQQVGASMAITRTGSRISGDMYSAGALLTHRHLALAIALDSVGTGSYQYSLSFKTDTYPPFV